MNKSDQKKRSTRNGRRPLLVAGVALTAALMVVPMMTFANTSSNQPQEVDDSSAQTNVQQPKQTPQNNSVSPNGGQGTLGSTGKTLQGGQSASGSDPKAVAPQSGNEAEKPAPQDNTPEEQTADGKDHKPQLVTMLSYNDRVDSVFDELRMDFVLRVAHGDVNPNCVPLARQYPGNGDATQYGRDGTGQCGLQIYYTYQFDSSKYGARSLRRASYMNTLGKDTDSEGAKKAAATEWAYNQDEYFTIENLTTSPDKAYDYLTISLEGDEQYPDNPAGSEKLGGLKFDREVYAIVSGGTTGGKAVQPNKSITGCGNLNAWCFANKDSIVGNSNYATNITEHYPVYLYNTNCSNGNCAGPISFVGYDSHDNLWATGQANWGLRTENGFNVGGKPSGTAPAKSFFAYWNNPGYSSQNRCGYTSTFYYQWFGLKDGNWVPATSITTKALASNGQTPSAPGTAPGGVYKNDGVTLKNNMTNAASFNAPDGKNPDRTIMGDNMSDKGGAQNSDGSIDFAKAKEIQGLDGYFKLVAWPTTTDKSGNLASCVSTKVDTNTNNNPNQLSVRDVDNPLYGGFEDKGVSMDMATGHPDQAQYLMNLGWTVGTAFDNYQYKTINTPEQLNAPTYPNDGKTDPEVPANVDHTPKLMKMLAYNNKVDDWKDEIRADFVLRTARGDVDPGCVGMYYNEDYNSQIWYTVGSAQTQHHGVDVNNSCGLRLSFNQASNRLDSMREVKYINTLKTNNVGENTDHSRAHAAYWWAREVGALDYDLFTIRDVQTKNGYDYLTISLAGNTEIKPPRFVFGGEKQDLKIVAEAGVNRGGKTYSSNVTNGYKNSIYNGIRTCGSNNPTNCVGPMSYVGYDETHPHLWAGGQTNWGLNVGDGFSNSAVPENQKGTAPAKSFFVHWYNRDTLRRRGCNKVTKYYFQWLGLAYGRDWVPVKQLTPTAQVMSQTAETNGEHESTTKFNTGDSGALLARDSTGKLMPAQNKDGSINFGYAKDKQPELDGYFKLVTWPISTNSDGSMDGCTADNVQRDGVTVRDVYNTLYGQPEGEKGITDTMANNNQGGVRSLIDKGWTIDTVYDGFSYKAALEQPSIKIDQVDTPHTRKEANGQLPAGSKVTVSGTLQKVSVGTMRIKLYMMFKTPGSPDPTADQVVANGVELTDPSNPYTVTQMGDQNWSVDVDPSKFLTKENVAAGDSYRFVAIASQDDESSSQNVSVTDEFDQNMDMTPSTVDIDKVSYKGVGGTVSSTDSHGTNGIKVTVIWDTGDKAGTCTVPKLGDAPDANACKTSETTADASGHWSVAPPTFVDRRLVSAYATDSVTNESAIVKSKIPLPRPVKQLPMTGSKLMWVLFAIVLLLAADLVYRKFRKMKAMQPVHAVASRGSVSSSADIADSSSGSDRGPWHKRK